MSQDKHTPASRGGMLLSLGRTRDEEADADATALLLACHRRIRHFTGVAAALASAIDAPSAEISAAASGVLRYFGEALPLHAIDEDESVTPRLVARAPEEVRDALAAMTRQHVELHRTLDRARDPWAAVALDPARLPSLAPDLARLAADLGAQWDTHLGLEEETIFPAIRALLPPDEQAAIRDEMRARRANAAQARS